MTAILKLPEGQKSLTMAGMMVEATSPQRFVEFLNRESRKYPQRIEAGVAARVRIETPVQLGTYREILADVISASCPK